MVNFHGITFFLLTSQAFAVAVQVFDPAIHQPYRGRSPDKKTWLDILPLIIFWRCSSHGVQKILYRRKSNAQTMAATSELVFWYGTFLALASVQPYVSLLACSAYGLSWIVHIFFIYFFPFIFTLSSFSPCLDIICVHYILKLALQDIF